MFLAVICMLQFAFFVVIISVLTNPLQFKSALLTQICFSLHFVCSGSWLAAALLLDNLSMDNSAMHYGQLYCFDMEYSFLPNPLIL